MRILFLTNQYFPSYPGSFAISVNGLVHRAKRQGNTVQTVVIREPPETDSAKSIVRRTLHNDMPLVEIGHRPWKHDARTEYDNPAIGSLVAKEIQSFRPDIIHVFHGKHLSTTGLNAVIESGKPMVVTLLDYWFVCLRENLLRPGGIRCHGPRHPLDCIRCARATSGVAQGPWNQARESREWLMARWGMWRKQVDPVTYWDDLRAIRDRNPALRKLLLNAHCILTVSNFVRDTMVKNGFPRKQIEVLRPGTVELNRARTPSQMAPRSNLGDVLRVGRVCVLLAMVVFSIRLVCTEW